MLQVVGEPVGLNTFLLPTAATKHEDKQGDEELPTPSRASMEEKDRKGKAQNNGVGGTLPPILSACGGGQGRVRSSHSYLFSPSTSSSPSSTTTTTTAEFTKEYHPGIEGDHASVDETHPFRSFVSGDPGECSECPKQGKQGPPFVGGAAPVGHRLLATTDRHYVVIKGTEVGIFADWYVSAQASTHTNNF